MRHNSGRGIMTQLVQCGPVPVDRFEIGLGRRDLHIVERRHIEGAIAADAEIDAGGADQRLDLRLDEAWRRWRRDNRDIVRQAVALRGVEHREALQERDRLGLVARLAGAPLLVVGHEAVGIDDGRASLALADIAAQRQRLAKGEPALAGKTVLDDGAPEDQHIDPGIMPAGGGVLRHGERRLRRLGPPGLDPGHTPASNSPMILPVISSYRLVRSWPARADAVFLDIADLRNGRRKLSPSSQPVTAKPVRTLTLQGRCGAGCAETQRGLDAAAMTQTE